MRSLKYFVQDNIFSFDYGKSSKPFLSEANQGILYPDKNSFRTGLRMPPRANDSNWAISGIFKLKSRSDALFSIDFLRRCSSIPQIIQSIRKEIRYIETLRYKDNFTVAPKIGWNKIDDVRFRPRTSIRDISDLLLSELDECDIDYEYQGEFKDFTN